MAGTPLVIRNHLRHLLWLSLSSSYPVCDRPSDIDIKFHDSPFKILPIHSHISTFGTRLHRAGRRCQQIKRSFPQPRGDGCGMWRFRKQDVCSGMLDIGCLTSQAPLSASRLTVQRTWATEWQYQNQVRLLHHATLMAYAKRSAYSRPIEGV